MIIETFYKAFSKEAKLIRLVSVLKILALSQIRMPIERESVPKTSLKSSVNVFAGSLFTIWIRFNRQDRPPLHTLCAVTLESS